ncbi:MULTISPECIES: dihydrofolate reductase family protein [Streptomyces]|uniref:Dihydrofolate reductase n=1 Tax=Streptomyces clavifer TaxID=68188 RepID=A0ABS4V8Q0_9ACTN|nr:MULTISPECIES: dihydrofolate reductase family protein [Streptomyces]KQX77874.1 deaminase [Streptomyces sp. Root1319]KQZ10222.1 deaminase [Streptomyces sp. Root55]MBP2360288.1 dihydrofolate reductase [Streptomyces clavifer]MDX2743445.1 dihydrofolate reductase family protein [Streptomyces sp. NRRL_B-2557]MDX3062124.1 dihydrofolate reductase family protein [Streptomyces sp. ND04-05B]
MRKLTYFVACSIDGFIGDPGGDATSMMAFVDEEMIEFLTSEYPETVSAQGREVLGFGEVKNRRFDTVIQGRASYQIALDAGLTSPYGHMAELVASRTLRESPDPNVELVSGDVVGRIRELKAQDSELGIWLCGGSRLAGELIGEVDELVIKTYPQVYGSGMPMFGADFAVTDFALENVRTFDNGVLVRTYSRKR